MFPEISLRSSFTGNNFHNKMQGATVRVIAHQSAICVLLMQRPHIPKYILSSVPSPFEHDHQAILQRLKSGRLQALQALVN